MTTIVHGATTSAAGEGLAGEDVVPSPSPARSVTPPAALWLDGATFSFLFDSAGLLVPLDPVDHRVAMLLLVPRGAVAGVPALGSTLRQIRKIDKRTQRTVENAVAVALDALTAAPAAIRVERVEVQTRRSPTSGYAVAVSYVNLRTASQRARTVTV
mgnify:CR=1 FL=1